MKRQIFDTRPRSLLNKGIAGVSTRFSSPAHRNPPFAAVRLRCPAVSGLRLSLWRQFVALFAPARVAVAIDGVASGTAMRCLLALSLALGATCASAQTSGIPAAQDTSVDVEIGDDTYLFELNDFAFKDANGNAVTRSNWVVEVVALPDRGVLVTRAGGILRTSGNQPPSITPTDFPVGRLGNVHWVPPFDVISAAPGYTSFIYRGYSYNDISTFSSHGTVTINMVASTTQAAAKGAPTVTGGTGGSYAVNTPLTASVYGVSDVNGIDTSTLGWQWQEAAAPSSGTSVVSEEDYSDIADTATTGGLTSGFTPRAEHAGKYLRVCASFKDQHSTPVSEERCSFSLPVEGASSGSSLLLRLRLFLEGPLR